MEDGQRLQAGIASAVERYDLSRHPLWPDWLAGKLPVHTVLHLADLALAVLPLLQGAWEGVNDESSGETAAEQALLCLQLAEQLAALGAMERSSAVAELRRLVQQALLHQHTALGALFAIHSLMPVFAARLSDGIALLHTTLTNEARALLDHVNTHRGLAARAEQYLEHYPGSARSAAAEAADKVAQAFWRAVG